MTEQTITKGSRQVVIHGHSPSRFTCRLYVNHGETATTTCAAHKTAAGAARWASRILDE